MTSYYRDAAGNYLGALDDPPEGGIEVTDAPDDARQIWSPEGWLPLPEPVPEEISRRQFYEGLALKEWITRTEALAAMQTGAIPAALQAIADGMTDEDTRFKVLLMFIGNNNFYRSHPFVLVFAMARQMSEAETDEFWRFCAGL